MITLVFRYNLAKVGLQEFAGNMVALKLDPKGICVNQVAFFLSNRLSRKLEGLEIPQNSVGLLGVIMMRARIPGEGTRGAVDWI